MTSCLRKCCWWKTRNNGGRTWNTNNGTNHPIELSNRKMTLQRLNYMHQNPVEIGFVEKEEEWLHSSCGDYYGNRKGRIELIFLE